MKNLTIVGFILLAIALLLYYLLPEFRIVKLFEPMSLMGILAGIGIGLIVGGIVGYSSKGAAIRREQKRQEVRELKKVNEDLEKQAAELAKQQTVTYVSDENKNSPNY